MRIVIRSTKSPHKMQIEAHCLGHESPKTAVLSSQNDHFDILQLSNHAFCVYRVIMVRFDLRTAHRDRVAGKGREVVNHFPGLLGIGVLFGIYTLGGVKASAD